MKRIKRLVSLLLALLLTLHTALPAVNANAATLSRIYTYDGYTVSYTSVNQWSGGQSIIVAVTNTGNETLSNWAFRFNAAGRISNIWNAVIFSNDGYSYVIKNADYNYDIKPSETITWGYQLDTGNTVYPDSFALISKKTVCNSGYDVKLEITNDWGNTVQGQIIISNTTPNAIEAWELSFNSNLCFNSFWNCSYVMDQGKYTISYSENNKAILPGNTVTAYFSASKDSSSTPTLFNTKLSEVAISNVAPAIPSVHPSISATPIATNAPTITPTKAPEHPLINTPVATPFPTSTPVPTIGITPILPISPTATPTAIPTPTSKPAPTMSVTPTIIISFDDVDVLNFDDLLDMNNGNLDNLQYNSNGFLEHINGKCASFPVMNLYDAQKVIYGLKDLMAIDNIESLRFSREDHSSHNDIYYFTQYHNGVEIIGSTVTVIADVNSHEAYIVNSYYENNISLNTIPSVSPSEATITACTLYNAETVGTPELVIWDLSTEERTPKLVWRVYLFSDEIEYVCIDALTGAEVYSEPVPAAVSSYETQSTLTTHYSSHTGSRIYPDFDDDITVNVIEKNINQQNVTILQDEDRHLTVLDGRSNDATYGTGILLDRSKWSISDTDNLTKDDSQALFCLYNTAIAYDFFISLGWNGIYSWNDKKLDLSAFHLKDLSSQNYFENACFSPSTHSLNFGKVMNKKFWYSPETIYHEFSHAMVRIKQPLTNTLESGAISEAYADIFCEIIDSSSDWIMQAGDRSLVSPDTFQYLQLPRAYLGNYYNSINEPSSVIVHNNSTVISHAAYSMMQGANGLTKNELANLWYMSLDYYYGNSTPSFINCRRAVTTAARVLFHENPVKLAIVNQAFDDANIIEYQVAIVIKNKETNEIINNQPVTVISLDKEYCNLNICKDRTSWCDPEEELCPLPYSHSYDGCSTACCHKSIEKRVYPNGNAYYTVLREGIHRVYLNLEDYELIDNKLEVRPGKNTFTLYAQKRTSTSDAPTSKETGTISGSLIDLASGTPVSGLVLEIFAGNLSGQKKPSTECIQKINITNDNLEYVTQELPAGQYTVFVSDIRPDTTYKTQYPNSTFIINVEAGKDIKGRDVKLRQGYVAFYVLYVRGCIRDGSTNVPIPNIHIDVYDYQTNEMVTYCDTDENGYYEFVTSPGIYKLHSYDPKGYYHDLWDYEFVGVSPTEEEINSLPKLNVSH